MAAANEPPETQIKKVNDAYTGLLAISFLAMVGGAVLLFLEYQNYEGKKLPDSLKLDVPGQRLEAIPKSGEPPPPKEEPAKETGMLRPPVDAVPAPLLLPPVETVEVVRPIELLPPIQPAPALADLPKGIIQIPDVPSANSAIIPASASEPVPIIPAPPRPIIPALDPSVSDAPPLPTNRFMPPM